MKALPMLCTLVFFAVLANAQDETVKTLQTEAGKSIAKDPKDTSSKIWKTGGTFSFNLAQGTLSNWAAGGDKFSLSVNTFINAHAFYKKGKASWDNNVDIYYGLVKTTSLGTRKNDDRFDLLSKYGQSIHKNWNLTGLFNLRSQFLKGYEYPDANTKIYNSNFFAPAYLLLSPGFDYHPSSNFSLFLSPATSRWIIVNDTTLSTIYGLQAGNKSIFQFGAYASANYSANLSKVVTYKGKLDLFSNYKSRPQNIDLYMTNQFAAKISRVLSTTLSVSFIYDDDVKLFGKNGDSPGLQFQSLLGVGLLVKL
jgi:hypothetical protein